MLKVLLGLLYPVVIYFALGWFEPRTLALIVAVLLLLRWKNQATQLLAGLSWITHGILLALLVLCAVALIANDEMLLRLYPAVINLGMLIMFGLTLREGPSMIERFARLKHADLPPEGVAHTRQATYAWCAFFTGNGLIAAWTAIAASRETWALYNGLIAYVLMGMMFAGEWLLRRHRFPELR